MTETLFQLINKKINGREKITILCIGTDKILYDAYGPLVGYILKNVYKLDRKSNIEVIGDVKSPVHALNLREVAAELDTENSLIIAVDAALTNKKENHMTVIVEEGAIKPGSVHREDLPYVGEIGIKGMIYRNCIFNDGEFIRLGDIIKMAEETAEIINEAVNKYLMIEKQFEKIKEHATHKEIKNTAVL